MIEQTIEEIKQYQKLFWMGMVSTCAPEGTDLEEVVSFIDKMFEETLNEKEKV